VFAFDSSRVVAGGDRGESLGVGGLDGGGKERILQRLRGGRGLFEFAEMAGLVRNSTTSQWMLFGGFQIAEAGED